MPIAFIGIDPGVSGAMTTLVGCPCKDSDGGVRNEYLIVSYPYSTEDYRTVLSSYKCGGYDMFAVVEEVHSMPKQGVASTFKFGMNFGWIKGMLDSLGIPYQLIRPQRWKKEFSLIGKDKQASIDVARRLFPYASMKRTAKCRKDDDGIAESVLMAEYARRIREAKTANS